MNRKRTIHLNHRQRRFLDAQRKRKQKNMNQSDRVELTDHIVYTSDAYQDKHKVAGGKALRYLKQRIAEKTRKYKLPLRVHSFRKPLLTSCLLINRDARQRAFLPDKQPRHCLLVTDAVAHMLVSGVCMFVRITANIDADGHTIDGSWAIVPAEYRMMQATTIQTLHRRTFAFLRRYPYEISFDGRVQPAHLLFDYGLNPLAKKQRLWITEEYVQIKNTNKYNNFLRFWLHKPVQPSHNEQS